MWKWYEWRRNLMRGVQPNPAHITIKQLEQPVNHVTVITQNVDGLHALAGSSDVIELHGNIWSTFCSDCGRPAEKDLMQFADATEAPLRCAHCNGYLRPGVVWFGESLPVAAWRAAAESMEQTDIFFCVGTSSLVEPATSLPRAARAHGCTVVPINLEATSHDAIAQYVLRGKAAKVLPALVKAAWPAT